MKQDDGIWSLLAVRRGGRSAPFTLPGPLLALAGIGAYLAQSGGDRWEWLFLLVPAAFLVVLGVAVAVFARRMKRQIRRTTAAREQGREESQAGEARRRSA